MPERLTLHPVEGSDALAVDGELDLTTVDELRSIGEARLAEGDLVLDCGGLRFIDSTGLSTLVELHHAAEAAGRSLRLTDIPDHARRLMQITKIDELLGI